MKRYVGVCRSLYRIEAGGDVKQLTWWEDVGPMLIVFYASIAMLGAITGAGNITAAYVLAAGIVGMLMAWFEHLEKGRTDEV